MKLKYYLRGLGLGILFTTIVLTIAFHNGQKESLSDEEIIKRAGQLGMVMEKKGSLFQADTEVGSEGVEAASPTNDGANTSGTQQAGQPGNTGQKDDPFGQYQDMLHDSETEGSETSEDTEHSEPQSEDTESVESTEPESETESEPESKPESETGTQVQGEDQIKVTIEVGAVCRELAEDLQKKGIITDAEEFRVYLGEHGYANKLQAGEFRVKKGMTYEELGILFTTRPQTE